MTTAHPYYKDNPEAVRRRNESKNPRRVYSDGVYIGMIGFDGGFRPKGWTVKTETLEEKAIKASVAAPLRAQAARLRAPSLVAARPSRSDTVKTYVIDAAKGHCDRCNASTWHGLPVRLQAHHILDFNTYPERDDIWNVIALCGNCHDLCPPGNSTAEGAEFNDELNIILSYIRPPREN